jgi:Peptidase C65 Otubain
MPTAIYDKAYFAHVHHVSYATLCNTNRLLTLLLLLLLMHVQYDRYSHLRSVRGEGNCYYRAVAFAAIEHHIVHSHHAALEDIALAFALVNYGNEYHNNAHNALVESLRRVRSGLGWFAEEITDSAEAARQFAKDMADPKSTTDGALIRVCRELTAQKLHEVRSRVISPDYDHSVEDHVRCSSDCTSLEEVCTYSSYYMCNCINAVSAVVYRHIM